MPFQSLEIDIQPTVENVQIKDFSSKKKSASQREKIIKVKDAIARLENRIGKLIPIEELKKELKGKMDGLAIRVPTPTVSIVDVVLEVEKDTTKEEVNKKDHQRKQRKRQNRNLLKAKKSL